MATTTKDLIARRGTAKGSITRLVTYADSISERTVESEISTRLELLERAFNDFIECDAKLAAQEIPSEMVEYETKYLRIKTKLKQYLAEPKMEEAAGVEKMVSRILKDQNDFLTTLSSSFTTSLNQTVSHSLDEPHCSFRLPRLNVPTFSGDYKEFPSFKDLYTASVHSKIGITDAEKFQYLRGYLRGEAANLIKHILVSEANYTQAWQKLCDRYDKRKYVLNDMIKQLIDQPTMQGSSVKKLRQLFNNADEVHRGIEALGGAAKNRDPWLIYLMLHKTDSETQQAWAHKTVNKEFPSFEEFLSFVSERCDALESCESIKPITTRSQTSKTHQLMVPVSEECVSCKADHKLHECSKFKSLDVIERKEQAATLHVCFNCLGSRHRAQECLSRRRCSKCGRKHHTLLHTDKVTNQSHITRDTSESSSKMTTIPLDKNQATTSSSHAKLLNACHLCGTILPTAVVKTQDRFGQFKLYSALLDSGSQITFVSKRLVTQLGIHCKPGRLRVEGIATSRVTTLGSVYLTIHSQFDESCCIKIKAFVLPKTTTLAASSEILCDQIEQYSDLQLADPAFYQQKEIDILIGADYFFHILREKQIEFTANTRPILGVRKG